MTYNMFRHATSPGDIRDVILKYYRDEPIDIRLASDLASSIYTKVQEEKKKACLTCSRVTRRDYTTNNLIISSMDEGVFRAMLEEALRGFIDESG